ncbi:MAG: LCP family protein [Lachnospiraceae bacterium]|nr:LCP family protein [Lachnospiraceae bacterium]
MQDYNDNKQNANRQGTRRPVSRQGQLAQGQRRRPANGQPAQGQRRRPANGQPAQGQKRRPINGQGHPSDGQRRPRPNAASRTNNKKKAKKKSWKIVLFVVEILVICTLVGACWVMSKANMIQHVKITDEEKKEELAIDETIAESEVLKGYRNIALFGVDSRQGKLDKSTLSDTIMIASINLDTKEVKLVSVYRDTWLNLSNDSYNKANSAYSKGGYKQAMAMLNMNLDLDVEDFVTIGFDGLIDVIDAVGGIEIDVKQAEIQHINSYQISMVGKPTGELNANNEPNYYAEPYVEYTPVERAGLQKLNGLQATAYARVRYVGSDLERAQRQRTVLTKVAQKAMTLNPATLNKIANAVFPKVMTSLELSEILELLKDIASYDIGETTGFPFDDYIKPNGRVGNASVVVPVDLEKNVTLLHQFMFGDEDYEPSETVKKCSKKIASDTGVSYSGE